MVITTVFMLAALPYDYAALAPAISEETLRYHHGKHTAAYVAKLNELIAGTPYASLSAEEIIRTADGAIFNNAAQMWNHNFYFAQLAPVPKAAPEGALMEAITAAFGSLQGLHDEWLKHCLGLFGSGWVWLTADADGRLALMDAPNAGNPLTRGLRPLACVDVWEHAYYIDYRNVRADGVNAVWSKLDWAVVEQRYAAK